MEVEGQQPWPYAEASTIGYVFNSPVSATYNVRAELTVEVTEKYQAEPRRVLTISILQ
jgi:hypothetical protein